MDHEAAVARAAKFASPKYQIASFAVHALIVAGVAMLLIKLSPESSITFSRWLRIVSLTTIIAVATWTLLRSRGAGAATRMLRLMAAQQLCFAVLFSASFIRSETVSLAVTFSALAPCVILVFYTLRELRAFKVRVEAQAAETMLAIERAKALNSAASS